MDRADAIVDECEGIVARVLAKELEPKAAKAVAKVVKSFRYPGEGRKGKEA